MSAEALLHERGGRHEAALAILPELQALHPAWPTPAVLAADLLVRLDRHPEAWRWL